MSRNRRTWTCESKSNARTFDNLSEAIKQAGAVVAGAYLSSLG